MQEIRFSSVSGNSPTATRIKEDPESHCSSPGAYDPQDIKMFPYMSRNRQLSLEPGGLSGGEDFSSRLPSPPGKEYHTPSNTKGDHTSDTSSSYHTAPGSEEAENFKDCLEYFEEPEDHFKWDTYCGSENERESTAETTVLPATWTSHAERKKKSKVTAGQVKGVLSSCSRVLPEGLSGANSKGKDNTRAPTAGRSQAPFRLDGKEILGDPLPVQEERLPSLQSDRVGTIKNQTCRDKLRSSGKESQQVQMSIKAKNSSDPASGVRMGLVTQRLQPGDSKAKYLDQPAQLSSDKSREMLPSARKLKKSGLCSRAHGSVSNKPACPKFLAENPSRLSDSDEADNEVEKLTALSFQSLSCPQGSYLDMYSSSNRTSSSLSNSLPDDSNGMNRWLSCSDQRKTVASGHGKGSRQLPQGSKAPQKELLGGVMGKEPCECVDVTLENADGKKCSAKKRMVPKRQIQLRRKEKKEASFCGAASDCVALQPFTQPRKESCAKGRSISNEFRINYKQFLKAASLSNAYNKTKLASNLVKNVLAKKMQYEQRIKMEQASVRGSSTSSVPSSISTDLPGDSLEGKSSSLSKSDCSFSTEDVQSHSTSERSETIAVNKESMGTLRPRKGVVLNEELRESVCKLKNTFNELNERLKYQEVTQLKRLPILVDNEVEVVESSVNTRKHASGERKEYRRARAVFESMQPDTGSLPTFPKFAKPQKPWPNLKQRAIRQNKYIPSKEEKIPLKPPSIMVPDMCSNIFTSETKEMKLIPQAKNEHSTLNAYKHTSLDAFSSNRRLPTFQSMKLSTLSCPGSDKSHSVEKSNCPITPYSEENIQMDRKGKAMHRQRDVRKLGKDSYGVGFKSSDTSSVESKSESGSNGQQSTVVSPLFIRCTSICRREDAQIVNGSQEKKQEQTGDLSMSTLSLQDHSTNDKESTGNLNSTTHAPGNISVSHPESRSSAGNESAVHITTIQSKKLVAENKEFQQQIENKLCERTELNVIPSASPKKESQLNIQVSSSLSRQPHKTETDYFPVSNYSTLDERATKEAVSPSNHNLLRENRVASSTESLVMPSSTCLNEVTKKGFDCAATSHINDTFKTSETEMPYQKHISSENISGAPQESKASPKPLKGENTLFESGSSYDSCRFLPATQPSVTSIQNIPTQIPANSHFSQTTAETKVLEDSKSLDNYSRVHSECVISDNPLTTKEYTEGIKVIPNSPFTPLTSYGKLCDSGCDSFNKNQAIGEYFAAPQADGANYLTIPLKSPQAEATIKHPVSLHSESPSFTSNVSFQPSGEPSGSKTSNDFLPQKQVEKKAPSDHLLYNNSNHAQIPIRREESPNYTKRNEVIPPCSKTAPSPTRHFAASAATAAAAAPPPPPPPLQTHRKMLVDPENGKCYYVEPPRQPQLKMLYDPETGQYIEVLIPPVPLASHGGLYQSPFSPVMMNPGGYGPPYMPYSGYPGFPPPPPAVPPIHFDLQDQQPLQENANFNESVSHFSKNEVPPAPQSADGNYMESLYYIPTGMNTSPNPNQASFSPSMNSVASGPDKGSFVRM